eukprot:5562114-Pleurochrysis_carterae.AAC.1
MVRRSDTEKLSVGRRRGKKASKELATSSIRTSSACSIKHTWISVTDPSGLVVDERILVVRVTGVGGIGAKA